VKYVNIYYTGTIKIEADLCTDSKGIPEGKGTHNNTGI